MTDVAALPSTTLIGFALDGFPIYRPLDNNSVLDECNGIGASAAEYRNHVCTLPQVNETLSYCNSTSPAVQWNYILGCFKGNMSLTAIYNSTTGTLPSDCVLDTTPAPAMMTTSAAPVTATPAPVTATSTLVTATPTPVTANPAPVTATPLAPVLLVSFTSGGMGSKSMPRFGMGGMNGMGKKNKRQLRSAGHDNVVPPHSSARRGFM